MAGVKQSKRRNNFFLVLALVLNICFWFGSSDIYAKWGGVPPVPSHNGAIMMGLGDPELSFRLGALTLQNLGDSGGRVTPMRDYDYKALGEWFRLLHRLDPASDHVPMLAAYYFGGTRVPSDVAVVVDYLSYVGTNPAGVKWRWLVHAAFLARHRLHDTDRALDIAYTLSKMKLADDIMPLWARQMPAFLLTEKGDREAARKITESLLLSSNAFDPNEVNFMRAYLVEQLGVDSAEVEAIMRERAEIGEAVTGRGRTLPAPQPE